MNAKTRRAITHNKAQRQKQQDIAAQIWQGITKGQVKHEKGFTKFVRSTKYSGRNWVDKSPKGF